MEIIRTPIDDLIIFRPTPIRDERGYFSRPLDIQTLAEAGIDPAGSNRRTSRAPTRADAVDCMVEQGMDRDRQPSAE
jgi:dTDP-4-dehydrorhamnose 3,5-epimerase-like enzyme